MCQVQYGTIQYTRRLGPKPDTVSTVATSAWQAQKTADLDRDQRNVVGARKPRAIQTSPVHPMPRRATFQKSAVAVFGYVHSTVTFPSGSCVFQAIRFPSARSPR